MNFFSNIDQTQISRRQMPRPFPTLLSATTAARTAPAPCARDIARAAVREILG